MLHMNSGPDDRYEYGPDQPEILDSRYRSPRRRPHLAGLAAVAVIALAAGGGIAYVATHSASNVNTDAAAGAAQSPSPSPSASAPSFPGHGPRGFGRLGLGGFGAFGFGGLGGVIHGQVTVPKSGGGYQTEDVQSGTVTAVSSSSITVKSADGYSATYAVASSTEVNAQAAGIGTVKTGDTVRITATVSGGKTTAASIIDLTSIRSSRGAFGFPSGPPASSQN
jgi:hypothetical protein